MTIRIPIRLVLFILYTAAVLGGAFGISYVVFQWRDDNGRSETTVESLDKRMQNLVTRLDTLNGDISNLRTEFRLSSPPSDSQCHNALLDLILVVAERASSGGSPALVRDGEEAVEDINRHC